MQHNSGHRCHGPQLLLRSTLGSHQVCYLCLSTLTAMFGLSTKVVICSNIHNKSATSSSAFTSVFFYYCMQRNSGHRCHGPQLLLRSTLGCHQVCFLCLSTLTAMFGLSTKVVICSNIAITTCTFNTWLVAYWFDIRLGAYDGAGNIEPFGYSAYWCHSIGQVLLRGS